MQPVEYDLVDARGRKLAGAGQRRTVRGLLHQGSVAGAAPVPESLAAALAEQVRTVAISPPADRLAAMAADRYANGAWTSRR